MAGLTLPSSSSIHWRAEFYEPERIVVGEYCTIGDSAFLEGRSGLTTDDCVNLGSYVTIYTRQHAVDSPWSRRTCRRTRWSPAIRPGSSANRDLTYRLGYSKRFV